MSRLTFVALLCCVFTLGAVPAARSAELIMFEELGCPWCERWRKEVGVAYPNSPEGKPDILIGDLIALELKVNPSKNEINRCIGQCAGYSRLWITWMIMIDAPSSKIGRLEELLIDKGLEQIQVWNFS